MHFSKLQLSFTPTDPEISSSGKAKDPWAFSRRVEQYHHHILLAMSDSYRTGGYDKVVLPSEFWHHATWHGVISSHSSTRPNETTLKVLSYRKQGWSRSKEEEAFPQTCGICTVWRLLSLPTQIIFQEFTNSKAKLFQSSFIYISTLYDSSLLKHNKERFTEMD